MTDEPTQPDAQLTDRIERTDVGVSLTVKLKRGTATRDQDTITAKVKATTLDEAREDMDDLRAYVRVRSPTRFGPFNPSRSNQPSRPRWRVSPPEGCGGARKRPCA